jgi:predicted small secreted protein
MKLIMTVVAVGLATALAGCNTVEGLGRDVERGGEKLQNSSLKTRAEWHGARERYETEYDTARRNCAAGTEAERDACRDRERAQYSAQMNESRNAYRRSEMRSVSEEDRREDAYEAARGRCDSLRGADEDRCIADARRMYRQ